MPYPVSPLPESPRPDASRKPSGYGYLCDWYLLARARSDLALKRPARAALRSDIKKPAAVLRRLEAFAERDPSHPAIGLAAAPEFDALDLSILFVALRNALRKAVGSWFTIEPKPLELLGWAGALWEAEAVDQLARLEPTAPLRKSGLLESPSRPSTPLLTTCLYPSKTALEIAFADESAREAVCDALPRAKSEGAEKEDGSLLVWPADLSAQMERIVHAARTRRRVLEQTGLFDRLPAARGVHVLFQGPPGTGKTLAARTLAARLERPLRLVHVPDIQSRWVGEAEKAVRAMYRDAARDEVVLCVDEIDALIGRRSSGAPSWERSLVDAFLVEMESFEGVAVYTTNHPEQLDPAMERRLAFRLAIPRPGRAERARIWAAHLPPTVPLAADVDVDALAAHDLTGGEIQNAVLAALTEASLREPLCVTASDLSAGLRTATEGRWTTEDGGGRVGFGAR